MMSVCVQVCDVLWPPSDWSAVSGRDFSEGHWAQCPLAEVGHETTPTRRRQGDWPTGRTLQTAWYHTELRGRSRRTWTPCEERTPWTNWERVWTTLRSGMTGKWEWWVDLDNNCLLFVSVFVLYTMHIGSFLVSSCVHIPNFGSVYVHAALGLKRSVTDYIHVYTYKYILVYVGFRWSENLSADCGRSSWPLDKKQ